MGVWGTRLYSGDFAMDLRSTVGAVSRLPFEPARLVEILCETEPSAARDRNDPDHTTFWLVLADQFAKRGIACERAREQALAILDAGDDLARLEKLGMQPADLRRRRVMLEQLRAALAAPVAHGKPRKVLARPQPLLMETGDAMVFPTCAGRPINPYWASKEKATIYTQDGPRPWTQDAWGALVIVDCGRAFEFLVWYRAVTQVEARGEMPSAGTLGGALLWRLGLPGTCSAQHFKKMELRKIGTLPVDREKLHRVFPGLRPGIAAAVSNISLANCMSTVPALRPYSLPPPGTAPRGLAPTMLGIEQILRQ